MAKIILVTGGARSGKSSYALERAESLSFKRLFLATCPDAEAGDDSEMSDRIQRHKEERRGRGWVTVESEVELAEVFAEQGAGFDVVLLDCITLWVSNVLFALENEGKEVTDLTIGDLCKQWLYAAEMFPGTVIIVTNEVGMGIVPDNALARKYRDLVGTCNQLIGKAADEVVLVSCGIPLTIKQNIQ